MNFWKLLSLVGAALFVLILLLASAVQDPGVHAGSAGAPRQAPAIPITR